MKFSILIANYNNGKYFKDCYDSIIAQTYKDWEAVIIDDVSTDNSVEIIKQIIGSDIRFRFFKNEKNKGCGYTKNKCAGLASGEILGFLDPDDALTSDAIEVMIEAHKEHPKASLVHSLFYYCDEKLKQGEIYSLGMSVQVDKQFTNIFGEVTAFATFKKVSYEKTEGIDPNLKRAVDQDLYMKLAEVGDFFFLNKALYYYRFHSGGLASKNEWKALYNHLKVLINAEERRGVNFETQFNERMISILNIYDGDRNNLSNPRYLLGKIFILLKKNPKEFFKKLVSKN